MSGSPSGADDAALLDARAVALARPREEDESQQGSVALLRLMVGGQQIAIPVGDVREVLAPGPVARIPGANGVLTGLVGGHGGVLPVASLARLLGITTTARDEEHWVAVVDHPTAPLGLLVDSAESVLAVGAGALAAGALGAPSHGGGLLAAILDDGTLILRTDALMRDPRLMLASTDMTRELP